ncbi:hypothetical protein ACWDXV_34130 [Nocardia nova]
MTPTPPPSGVILYGPPAAGKDTVTTALAALDPRYSLFRRLKVGPGRTTGYRIGTEADMAALESAGKIIYANSQYGATYVIDRPEFERLLVAGLTPVVHLGQADAVDILTAATPAINWVTVDLRCPRDVARTRIDARGTGDTADRLQVWDRTPPLTRSDLSIDTSVTPAASAARLIDVVNRQGSWRVIVPVLTPVGETGVPDLAAARRYAALAAKTWTDYVLVNGSTTRGDLLSPADRAAILDVWIGELGPDRVLACSWNSADIAAAVDRRVTPMAVLRSLETPTSALDFLAELPKGSTVYSHPMYGSTFTAELARTASRAGCLPLGGKLAKVSLSEVTEIRTATPEFQVWDGSSRHIRASIEAGASGVVATPLAPLLASPNSLPPKGIDSLQTVLDTAQSNLDRLPDREGRRAALLAQLRAVLQA